MLDQNVTFANSTIEDIIIDHTVNSSLPAPPTPLSYLLSFLNSLDTTQLLYQPHCPGWVPLHHVCFQAAHALLLLSSFVPGSSSGFLFLRVAQATAFSLLTGWGWAVACGLDITVWSALIAFVHISLVLRSIWVWRSSRLSKDMEHVYTQLFQPLKVTRDQFKTLLNAKKDVRKLSTKEMIIEEKVSRVDSLSLVLEGRLVVSQAGRVLHLVTPNQFLDSPEWFGVTTDEYFQVSVTAIEECTILVWHRDKVRLQTMGDKHLQAVLDQVVARDVVRKLMQVQNIAEELQLNKNNVTTEDNLSIGDDREDYDDKKPMIPKDGSKDGSLMSTIIGGDLSNWRLGNIRETDDETIV